jgi:hypothetical protein
LWAESIDFDNSSYSDHRFSSLSRAPRDFHPSGFEELHPNEHKSSSEPTIYFAEFLFFREGGIMKKPLNAHDASAPHFTSRDGWGKARTKFV